MNRSTFLPIFALAFVAAPLAAPLAGEAPPPESAPAAAASSAGRQEAPPRGDNGTRCLSADERSELREQVRLAAEEHKEGEEAPPVKGDAGP